jgi:hypothetical protein
MCGAAAFTNTSTPPSSATTRSTITRTEASSVLSAAIVIVAP